MAEGEFALAKDHLQAAGQKPFSARSISANDTELCFMLADLAVLQRDEAALRLYAPPAEETALRDRHLLYQASAHRAWGVMQRLQGEYEAAEARLNQALELFQGLETYWQIGRTLSEIAELKLAQADPVQAKQYYSQALDSFEQIGAEPDATRIRQALASL